MYPTTPIPGRAPIDSHPGARALVIIRNVTLGTVSDKLHVDAVLDTGSTHCIVPPSVAKLLGYHRGNRLGAQGTNVVGGGQRLLDRHSLDYVKVGTARANRISFLVAEFGTDYRFFMLLGLSFIRKFMLTVNFEDNLILFRSRSTNGHQ